MSDDDWKTTGEGSEREIEEAVVAVGRLMALSARTAPKAMGRDFLEVRLLTGDEVDRLGRAMIEHGDDLDDDLFVRDGRSVLRSHAVLLVGLKDHRPAGLDCNACGFGSCKGFKRARKEHREGRYWGPACTFRSQDLGIALGSAVKTAQMHNVDNRIMYRAAVIAIEEGYIGRGLCLAVPLAAVGKSPFFDR